MKSLVRTDRGTLLVKGWDEYYIEICIMAYNARIVLTPLDCPEIYTHGWCYHKLEVAALAAWGWDPRVEDEPPGWHKRAGWPRLAPQREPEAPVRCDHGVYPGATCDYIGCTG